MADVVTISVSILFMCMGSRYTIRFLTPYNIYLRVLFSLLQHWISNEILKPKEILQTFILYRQVHFNRDEIEIVIHFQPILLCTHVMYGKNRRYFKTLATAVNTCRRENTEYNISYLFMCIHCGVGYRRYYTPWCTHMQCVISRKSHGCPNQRFIFIAHRLQSAGTNRTGCAITHMIPTRYYYIPTYYRC